MLAPLLPLSSRLLKMPFAINEVIEIEASQFRAIARVRNVQGDRIHVALEQGYLPWIDDPVLVRRLGESPTIGVDARILQASGTTALLELLEVRASASSDRLPQIRDTTTDEA